MMLIIRDHTAINVDNITSVVIEDWEKQGKIRKIRNWRFRHGPPLAPPNLWGVRITMADRDHLSIGFRTEDEAVRYFDYIVKDIHYQRTLITEIGGTPVWDDARETEKEIREEAAI